MDLSAEMLQRPRAWCCLLKSCWILLTDFLGTWASRGARQALAPFVPLGDRLRMQGARKSAACTWRVAKQGPSNRARSLRTKDFSIGRRKCDRMGAVGSYGGHMRCCQRKKPPREGEPRTFMWAQKGFDSRGQWNKEGFWMLLVSHQSLSSTSLQFK